MAAKKKIENMSQEELVALANEQAEVIATKEKENAEQAEMIVDLNKEITQLSKGEKSTKKVVVVGTNKKKKFHVMIPRSNYNGRIITADILANEPELVDELVKIESQVIQEI